MELDHVVVSSDDESDLARASRLVRELVESLKRCDLALSSNDDGTEVRDPRLGQLADIIELIAPLAFVRDDDAAQECDRGCRLLASVRNQLNADAGSDLSVCTHCQGTGRKPDV